MPINNLPSYWPFTMLSILLSQIWQLITNAAPLKLFLQCYFIDIIILLFQMSIHTTRCRHLDIFTVCVCARARLLCVYMHKRVFACIFLYIFCYDNQGSILKVPYLLFLPLAFLSSPLPTPVKYTFSKFLPLVLLSYFSVFFIYSFNCI